MKPERITALADGIFAICMTLLVLDIHVPISADLLGGLIDLLPKLLVLVISFFLLSIYWSSHHMLFARLTKADFKFMWRNIWFLLSIILVPFATALLGEYPYSHLAQTVYAGLLIICAGLLYGTIYYVLRMSHLMDSPPSLELRINVAGKVLFPPIVYLIAIVVGFWDTQISLGLLVVGPLSYFIPIDSRTWAVITKPFAKYIV